jgi:hypothetical protein
MSDLKRYSVQFQWTLQGENEVSVMANDRAGAIAAAKQFGLRPNTASIREFDFIAIHENEQGRMEDDLFARLKQHYVSDAGTTMNRLYDALAEVGVSFSYHIDDDTGALD